MSEQDNVDLDTQNQDKVDDTQSDTNNSTDNDSADEFDDVEKLREQNKKLFERAKKAEGFVKDDSGNWVKKPKPAPAQAPAPQQQADNGLSPKDLYALLEAKVPQADVDEVVRASKLLGKSIPEALNDGLVKARLRDLAEQRQTANATNTSGSKRTTVKLTDEGLVEQARQGKDVDPEALAAARINIKKAQRK